MHRSDLRHVIMFCVSVLGYVVHPCLDASACLDTWYICVVLMRDLRSVLQVGMFDACICGTYACIFVNINRPHIHMMHTICNFNLQKGVCIPDVHLH
jgi:hypothetical protein